MEKLLIDYTLSEIIVFSIILALAIKSIFSFWGWVKGTYKSCFDKDYSKKEFNKKIMLDIENTQKIIDGLLENKELLAQSVQKLEKQINSLILSDQDDIKAYLTKEHHFFCYQKGWIDDYSLECCEKRYKHYKDRGGNSFIQGFMEDLRALPKLPPDNE